jgi:hypothetical protein
MVSWPARIVSSPQDDETPQQKIQLFQSDESGTRGPARSGGDVVKIEQPTGKFGYLIPIRTQWASATKGCGAAGVSGRGLQESMARPGRLQLFHAAGVFD